MGNSNFNQKDKKQKICSHHIIFQCKYNAILLRRENSDINKVLKLWKSYSRKKLMYITIFIHFTS